VRHASQCVGSGPVPDIDESFTATIKPSRKNAEKYELKAEGKTIIFVLYTLDTVKELC
jgi:hypothetical protein